MRTYIYLNTVFRLFIKYCPLMRVLSIYKPYIKKPLQLKIQGREGTKESNKPVIYTYAPILIGLTGIHWILVGGLSIITKKLYQMKLNTKKNTLIWGNPQVMSGFCYCCGPFPSIARACSHSCPFMPSHCQWCLEVQS